MNLAEIRKKAQRARGEGAAPAADAACVAPPAPAAPALAPPAEEPEAEVRQAVEEPAAAAVQEPAGAAAEQPVSVSREMTAASFDPLSVILAGRLAAGSAADTGDIPESSREESADFLKYLRFRVADEDYGVSLLEIREIIKPRPVTEVPGMPGFVLGVISLRGTIIPVLDLRLRLGLAIGEPCGRERIIIARKGEGMCGLLVDEVFQVLGLSGTEIGKAPPVLEGIDREFVRGIGRHGERMLILLDLEKVMDVSLR